MLPADPLPSSPDLLERFARALGEHAHAKVVFGEAVRHDGVTVVPVARAAWGLGRGGSRDGRTPGPNMGGGATVRPIGFLEIRDEQVTFRPIRTPAPNGALIAAAAAAFAFGLLLGRRRS